MLVIQFIVGIFIGICIFLGGMYFYTKHYSHTIAGKNGGRCPNLLIQHGAKYYLLNTKISRVPGVNPIEFNTLEDYNDFLKWQHAVDIKCPVLYVQKTYDAQGKRVYKMRPSTAELKGGLPPTTTPHVESKHPDTSIINDITCGKSTPNIAGPISSVMAQPGSSVSDSTPINLAPADRVDNNSYVNKIAYPAELLPCPATTFTNFSDDPMDVNWGGEDYTEKSVKAGTYVGSEITTTTIGAVPMQKLDKPDNPFTQQTHL